MKVLILGGYGVFGERLARMLVRDRHGVTLAGRDAAKAQRLADELGCAALRMDRRSDLHLLSGYQVVVDAAGPFHAYGDETESLYPGSIALKAVSSAAREEILALFPELRDQSYSPIPARQLASGRQARKLAERHIKNSKALLC